MENFIYNLNSDQNKPLYDSITIIFSRLGFEQSDRAGKLDFIAANALKLMDAEEKAEDVIGNIANRYNDTKRMEYLKIPEEERSAALSSLTIIRQKISESYKIKIKPETLKILERIIKNLEDYQSPVA